MKVSQKITSITLLQNGGAIIVTSPSEYNKSGAFKLNKDMFNNLVLNAGCSSGQDLKLSCEGADFKFETTEVKAGEEWENKSGQKGNYTKDHTRIIRQEIKLSSAQENQIRILSRAKSIDLSSLFSIGGTSVAAGNTFNAAPAIEAEPANVVVAQEPV